MALVLDCSVMLPWFLEDERSKFTDELLLAAKRTEYWVPGIWSLEFPNALLMAERKGRILRQRRLDALNQVLRLFVRVDNEPIDLTGISQLAERHQMTTYDAAYLELALRHGFGIATLDRRLAAAASAEHIVVQSAGRSGVSQKRGRYNI